MHEKIDLKIHLARDGETGRWYVAESDIPGLWLEADNAPDLMRHIQHAAPEMIELNAQEIIARFVRGATGRKATHEEPHMDIRPIFDSPLDLAAA